MNIQGTDRRRAAKKRLPRRRRRRRAREPDALIARRQFPGSSRWYRPKLSLLRAKAHHRDEDTISYLAQRGPFALC